MTKQEDILEQLSAYMDGELSAPEVRRVEAALAEDESLAAEFEQLRAARRLVRSLPRHRAPAQFTSRILAQAHRRQLAVGLGGRYKVVRWITLAATAAVILIAACMGLFLVTRPPNADTGGPGEVAGVHRGAEPERGLAGKRLASKDDSPGLLRRTRDGKARGRDGGAAGRHAKGGAAKELAEDSELVMVDLYTDDLTNARRDVMKILAANSIEPVEAETEGIKASLTPRKDAHRWAKSKAISNFFNEEQPAPNEYRMSFYAPRRQVPKLKAELGELQRRQNVAQAPRDELVARKPAVLKKRKSESVGQLQRLVTQVRRNQLALLAEEADRTGGRDRRSGKSADPSGAARPKLPSPTSGPAGHRVTKKVGEKSRKPVAPTAKPPATGPAAVAQRALDGCELVPVVITLNSRLIAGAKSSAKPDVESRPAAREAKE